MAAQNSDGYDPERGEVDASEVEPIAADHRVRSP
jgi:hypothetical protein